MEAGCEKRLLEQRVTSLRALITYNEKEVHEHKKLAHQYRQEALDALEKIKELEEKCTCKE